MLTLDAALNWLLQKDSETDQKDAESFYNFLVSKGIESHSKITEDLYYDWIDSRI